MKQTLKGAHEIAEALEITRAAAFHMLEDGQIKCAIKKGRNWYANRQALMREFGAVEHEVEVVS
jgi:hypothetical protein